MKTNLRGLVCAVGAVILSSSVAFMSGCAGLVSSANSNGDTTSALVITSVQTASITTASSQVIWATNVPADSSVNYGISPSYGNTTSVDSAMVTTHQMTLSGLAAGTTYYYQVNSTDSKGNHGHGGNSFKTAGFSLSGTINPATGGSGSTLTLSGAASATTTADSSGNYMITGLANGTYTLVPSHAGYTFTPSSQSMTVKGANVTGVNFTDTAATVAPTITTQPVNQTVTAGQTATFTVVAGGTAPLSYQWQKNGANIAGATAISYTTPVTATTDSGSTYRVVVTNTAGTVTSAAATLTVTAATVAPTITTQPVNQTVTAGQTATFTVVAGGTAPLSYQWQKNGANIAGATGTSYTTPATATTDSGSTYRVVVTNTAGTVTSGAATLTVNAAAVSPTITTQPVNQTVTAGQTATFMVVAGGTAPLSYQWQKNGANIAGATGTSYTTPVTATTDSGSTFRVVVTNTAGTVTSAAATLTVNPAPAPAIQVSPSPINFGSDVVGSNSTQLLIIKNTGTATLTITQVNESGSAFSVSGYSLPLNVNAGAQTTITVTFVPSLVGTTSGSLSIVSNAPTSPTSVGLTGTGVAATLTLSVSPTSLSFGNVTTGTTSASQNVTITNTGNSIVTISQITLTGSGLQMTGGGAPVTLSPAQNLILTVQFNPTVAGGVNGSISIVSNAGGSPASVSLSGTGVDAVQHSVVLNWNASTSTVSGYNVYRSTLSGGPYTKVNSSLVTALTFADSTVQSGTTYYYVTTAVDSSGAESAYSNQVAAPIP
ncbi:MAG: choice-of-anchor D domain-containing protein [Candidatus Acidiferrum sp.]